MSENAIPDMNRHEIYANKKLDWKSEWKKKWGGSLVWNSITYCSADSIESVIKK